MTKESFEKLVENEQNKDEILQRVMTGLGVLNNDLKRAKSVSVLLE